MSRLAVLWYIVLGDWRLLSVKIDPAETRYFSQLNKIIHEELKNSLFRDTDAADLTFWKVKDGVDVYPSKTIKERLALGSSIGLKDISVEMDPASSLESEFANGYREDWLHIIVTRPEGSNLGPRKRIRSGGDASDDGSSLKQDCEWGQKVYRYAKTFPSEESKGRLDFEFNFFFRFGVIIRPIYAIIYDYIRTHWDDRISSPSRGLVVWGQPGIGKTGFLYYVLVRALYDGLPVIWCMREDPARWIQFTRDGDVEAYAAVAHNRLALYDQFPPEAIYTENIYVVQATSPDARRWKAWAKQYSAEFWLMGGWSEEEIENEMKHRQSITPNFWAGGDYHPTEIFKIMGPSARPCFDKIVRKKFGPVVDFGLDSAAKSVFNETTLSQLELVLRVGLVQDASQLPDHFHRIFFATPQPGHTMPAPFERCVYEIHTAHQRRASIEAFSSAARSAMISNARLFEGGGSVSGVVYESFAREEYMRGGDAIILCHLTPALTEESVARPSSAKHYDRNSRDSIQYNTLYIPDSGFASLDYFFVTHKEEVVLLQVTIAKTHSKKNAGIEEIVEYVNSKLTPALPISKFRFVYVTPSKSNGDSLLAKYPSGTRRITHEHKHKRVAVCYTVLEVPETDVLKILEERYSESIEAISKEEEDDNDNDDKGGRG